MTDGPKVLTLDIETSPSLAYVWGLWDQNVAINQIREAGQVICFAAKWKHQKQVMFHSDHHDGHEEMVRRAHELVSEADLIVHYNGTRFDMPHLFREFMLAELDPPPPHKDVDLLRVAKGRFKFPSNKLDYVARELGLGGKVSHTGFQLWADCLKGDDKAWSLMRKYNKQDVILTEQVYDRLLPWIKTHPHVGLYSGDHEERCGRCGSTHLQKRGTAITPLGKFQRYQCQGCGSWSRGGRKQGGVDVRAIS